MLSGVVVQHFIQCKIVCMYAHIYKPNVLLPYAEKFWPAVACISCCGFTLQGATEEVACTAAALSKEPTRAFF